MRSRRKICSAAWKLEAFLYLRTPVKELLAHIYIWSFSRRLPLSVDPNDQKKTACYDIDVEVEDPLKSQMSSFLLSTANQQEIASLDNKVRALKCVIQQWSCFSWLHGGNRTAAETFFHQWILWFWLDDCSWNICLKKCKRFLHKAAGIQSFIY